MVPLRRMLCGAAISTPVELRRAPLDKCCYHAFVIVNVEGAHHVDRIFDVLLTNFLHFGFANRRQMRSSLGNFAAMYLDKT